MHWVSAGTCDSKSHRGAVVFEVDRAIGFDLNKDTEDTLIPGVNQIYILSGYKTFYCKL